MSVRNQRLELRLSVQDMEALDAARGDLTRSEYLRRRIPRPDTPQTVAAKLKPITEAARQMTRHYHRFEKTDQIHHYDKGTPVYVRRCSCGETG